LLEPSAARRKILCPTSTLPVRVTVP